MAEVKNAFIKSKMNLDLDARLVPNGEYRQGFNIQVSKSEGDDVGALENVLGNEVVADFASIAGVSNLQVIGQFTSPVNNTIFVFLTNNTDPTYSTQPTFNPTASNFVYAYNTLSGESVNLVSGAFLNFSTTNLITGVSLLENLLFFTDNRNQPRKINITRTATYYTNEDQISVAKYAPFQAIILYKNSTTPDPNNGDTPLSGYESTMYDVISPLLPDGSKQNPYFQGTYNAATSPPTYNSTYAGDPDYLEDKFVRFSYRFKFDDNEYSVIAPFTQACFIPQQDGYFLTTGGAATTTDEDETLRSSIVRFMKNKVNEVVLQIPLPYNAAGNVITGNNLATELKIQEIEILYAEDFSANVQILESLDSTKFGSGEIIEYTYQATKPYRSLPESDLVRVYDKVPVRALSQEVIGNRVVYGNFQNKHTPPSSLNYNVGASQRSPFSVTEGNTSIVEYPNSTLKQNRNYQVGVVLSDRYGRSSTTLLSNNQAQSILSGEAFDASTVYHNYRVLNDTTNLPMSTFRGDSLKILFQETIESNSFQSAGTPGLYNGSVGSSTYNPLGWYTYKIVVKQIEQEYYNVYTPGILDGPPNGATTDDAVGQVGFVTLISDNINKVPKDLVDVGPDQKQFRSSVRLFGRVTPESSATPSYNTPFYPSTTSLISEFNSIIAIGSQNNLFGTAGTPEIYDEESNPFVTRISQIPTNPIGSLKSAATSYPFKLGVFETSPFESLLDIYYETSSSGLISVLNSAILQGDVNLSTGLFNFTPDFKESDPVDTIILATFAPQTAASLAAGDLPVATSDLHIAKIENGKGDEVQIGDIGDFKLERIAKTSSAPVDINIPATFDHYNIKTNKLFYYGVNSNTEDRYVFSFTNGTETNALTGTIPLQNVTPIIYKTDISNPISSATIILAVGDKTINANNADFNAVNGSADSSIVDENEFPQNKRSLEWSITSATPSNVFTINPITGVITVDQDADPSGLYNLDVRVRDATLHKDLTLTVTFGEKTVNPGFGSTEESVVSEALTTNGGSSLAIYWTSDATNANQNEGLDRTVGGVGTTALALSNTLGFTSEGYTNTASYNSGGPSPITYKNTDYNAIGSAKGVLPQADGGLSAGTGYVTVNINLMSDGFEDFNMNQPTPSEVFAMFPVILQYRSAGGGPNSWVTAKDVEGNDCTFGGTQKNIYDYYGGGKQPLNDQTTLQYTGTTFYNTLAEHYSSFGVQATSAGNNNNNALNSTCMEMWVESMSSNHIDGLWSSVSKTFVMGESQSYDSSYNKFGDYRLVVRYPWGLDNTTGSSTNYIVAGYNQTPSGEWNNKSLFEYNIQWGDFYYPGYSSANSYSYRLSGLGYSGPSIAASATPSPSREFFAREWHLKYVSQLYTDAALTTPWNPDTSTQPWSPSNAWYSYSPNSSDINATSGTDFSNVSNFGGINYNQTYNNTNRRWVAYFGPDGKKVASYAHPVITGRGSPLNY